MTAVSEAQMEALRGLMLDAGRMASAAAARRGELQRSSKAGPLDPVTEADLAVETMMRARLAAMFPGDGFWGEESGRPEVVTSGRLWLCDPIDGTRSFLRLGHDFCVSLGLLVDGVIAVALICDPQRGDLYEARAGAGARLNGRPLRLEPLPSLGHALVGIGFSERVSGDRHVEMLRGILRDGAMLHQHGSGALALAQVAAGRLDAYVELHQNAWDALPGLLIAEEAGALCLEWRPGDVARGTLTLAANPGVAPALARHAGKDTAPIWGVGAAANSDRSKDRHHQTN